MGIAAFSDVPVSGYRLRIDDAPRALARLCPA
jgi:hypothetical protein